MATTWQQNRCSNPQRARYRWPDETTATMGLDIYVGPLCRYYAGDWETVVQRRAREQGIALNVVRAQPASADALRDPKDTLPIVTAWREGLALALKDEGVSLFWQEQPDGIYFTDKPAWDCYGDLLLWAAYSEH